MMFLTLKSRNRNRNVNGFGSTTLLLPVFDKSTELQYKHHKLRVSLPTNLKKEVQIRHYISLIRSALQTL